MTTPARPVTATVSIPYYRCRPYVRAAVDSILGQTVGDFVLVVVNDGDADEPWDELHGIDDRRLVRFTLEANHGRYFADAVVLGASDSPYFLVQDADDRSDPTRLEVLATELRRRFAVSATSTLARDDGTVLEQAAGELNESFRHRYHHHGLHRTEVLKKLGGYYNGQRIGFDTLLMNLIAMTGPVAAVRQPLYHLRRRPGSLTTVPATALGSRERSRVKELLERQYGSAYSHYQRYLKGELDHEQLTETIRGIVRRDIAPQDSALIEAESERLRKVIRDRPGASSRRVVPLREIVEGADWGPWAIGKPMALALHDRLLERRPSSVLECGSGCSTLVLARYASTTGARVVSLEHDADHASKTRQLLARYGLLDLVDLRVAPLVDGWYANTLSAPVDSFEVALVDGPPLGAGGRGKALPRLFDVLTPGWELWLHDATRDSERTCVDEWQKRTPLHVRYLLADDARGLVILRHAPWARIGIGVLTGLRPALLQQTLEALAVRAPNLVAQAHVTVFANGGDVPTLREIERCAFVNAVVVHEGNMLAAGEATSKLVREVCRGGAEYLLHLEDDWLADDRVEESLLDAVVALERHPEVGQVRLRRAAEPVKTTHMITNLPIEWKRVGPYRVATSAHFTFNPMLMRAADAARLFPCGDEREAQARAVALGWACAQAFPGAFSHIGAEDSLRARFERR